MSQPLVKICGVTELSDARLAEQLGAQYIGMVLTEKSVRKITRTQAQVIIKGLRGKAKAVAVFFDESDDLILDGLEECPFAGVQIYKPISDKLYEKLKSQNLFVIQAVIVDPAIELVIQGSFDFLLLDAPKFKNQKSKLCLDSVRRLNLLAPYFVAGGLETTNVAHYIQSLQPFAVDVCSGLESSPRVKDSQKMKSFFSTLENL